MISLLFCQKRHFLTLKTTVYFSKLWCHTLFLPEQRQRAHYIIHACIHEVLRCVGNMQARKIGQGNIV